MLRMQLGHHSVVPHGIDRHSSLLDSEGHLLQEHQETNGADSGTSGSSKQPMPEYQYGAHLFGAASNGVYVVPAVEPYRHEWNAACFPSHWICGRIVGRDFLPREAT